MSPPSKVNSFDGVEPAADAAGVASKQKPDMSARGAHKNGDSGEKPKIPPNMRQMSQNGGFSGSVKDVTDAEKEGEEIEDAEGIPTFKDRLVGSCKACGASCYKLYDEPPTMGEIWWQIQKLGKTKRGAAKKILVTAKRKAEKARLKRRPKRVHFRLPKSKNVTVLEALDPASRWVIYWRNVMVLFLSYEVWAFPFRLSFGVPSITGIATADIACDCVFFIDTLVTCATMIPPYTLGPDQEKVINSFSQISAVYIKKDFVWDYFPLVLYYAATIVLNPSNQLHLWIWWASTIPRMYRRCRQLLMFFREKSDDLEVNVRILEAVKFALIILFSCHWVGCSLFWISRLMELDETTWVHEFTNLLPLFDKSSSPISTKYLLCLYKGFNAMSNLAYDYGMPRNWVEMVANLFIMTIQVYLSALILGTLLNYLVRNDPADEAHKTRMGQLAQYADQHAFPLDLRERIFKHFEFQFKRNRQNAGVGNLSLPKSLNVRIAQHKFSAVMDKCTQKGKILGGCSQAFLDALIVKLQSLHIGGGEEFARKDDLPQELYFVVEGAVFVMDEENRVVRVIRSDVPDMVPMAGQVPFFIGIQHRHTLRAQPNGDIQLLVLSRADADALFSLFPDEQENIKENILSSYGLDQNGQDRLAEAETVLEGEADDIKTSLRKALRTQAYQRFAGFVAVCENDDLEGVTAMVRKGMPVDALDYDGRSLLHRACTRESYKMVEMLLEAGADINLVDRWGNTPLKEAIDNHQWLVVKLLERHKAALNIKHPSDAMLKACLDDDIGAVKMLIENGVSANICNFDSRTGLHVAAAKGHDEIVQYLIAHKADINAKDRWGGTPLKDAVLGGHNLLATIIRSKGGNLPPGMGEELLCTAASNGDIQQLQLLYECDEDVNAGDYDARCPLHLASAEARILAVAFLLSHSANPNCEDRWGGRPLDDALRGETYYHMLCGKLIESWGGKSGTMVHTEEGQELIAQMDKLEVTEALALVQKLTKLGYDRKVVERVSEEDMLLAIETSLTIIPMVKDMHVKSGVLAEDLNNFRLQNDDSLHNVLVHMKKLGKHLDGQMSKGGKTSRWTSAASLSSVAISDKQQAAEQKAEGGVDSRTLEGQVIEMMNQLEEEGEQDENVDDFDDGAEMLDSDEEEQLHQEVDRLLAAQERCEEEGIDGQKLASNAFQKASLRILEVSEALQSLSNLFRQSWTQRHVEGEVLEEGESPTVTQLDLTEILGVVGVKIGGSEVEEIFEEAMEYEKRHEQEKNKAAKGKSNAPGAKRGQELSKKQKEKQKEQADAEPEVSFENVLCGSTTFRSLLFNLEVDEMVCLMMKSRLSQHLTESYCRQLITTDVVKLSEGDEIFGENAIDTGHGNNGPDAVNNANNALFYIVLEGHLSCVVPEDAVLEDDEELEEPKTLMVGDIFGAFHELSDEECQRTITALEPCKLLPIRTRSLIQLLETNEEVKLKFKLAQAMQEAPASYKTPDERSALASTGFSKMQRALSKRLMSSIGGQRRNSIGRASSSVYSNGQAGSVDASARRPSSVRKGFSPLDELQKQSLKEKMVVLDDLWFCMAMGGSMLSMATVNEIGESLGEATSLTYHKLFQNPKYDPGPFMNEEDYWCFWLHFLGDDEEEEEVVVQKDVEEDQEEGAGMMDLDEDAPDGFFDYLHSKYSPARSLQKNFFEASVIDQYEAAYQHAVGDMKKPLTKAKASLFLSQVFVEYPYPISQRNVKEFFKTFSKDGVDAKSITWYEMRLVLRERRMGMSTTKEGYLVGTTLNPNAAWVKHWKFLIKLCAIYYVVMVPVRAAFLPWASMTAIEALVTDLPVDVLVTINLFIRVNMAYKSNKTATWIQDRFKIFRRVHVAMIVSAVPIDWLAWISGVSTEVACFCRMGKMFLILACRSVKQSSTDSWQSKVSRLVIILGTTLHFSACIWFFIGRSYQSWFPNTAISWYHVDPSLADLTFERDPYYGWNSMSTSWDQYLLSVYWVAATMTVNGAVGDVIPQNQTEIVFTIALMVLNMTLFRWIIGEISGIIMNADMHKVKLREEFSGVNLFIIGNKLSSALGKEIKAHYHAVRESSSLAQGELFNGMSYVLQVDTAKFMYRESLESIALFEGCSDAFLDAVCVVLQESMFAPETLLFQQGVIATECFFVVTGSVEKVVDTEKGEYVDGSVQEGGSAGDLAFFFGIKHMNSGRASAEGVVALRLVRDQFMAILAMYPEDEELISNNTLTNFESSSAAMSVSFGQSVAGMSVASSADKKSRAGSAVGGASSTGGHSKKSKDSKKSKESKGSKGQSALASSKDSDGSDAEEDSASASSASSAGQAAQIAVAQKKQLQELKSTRSQKLFRMVCMAAKCNDPPNVFEMLETYRAEISIGNSDEHGRTLMHVAASEGHHDLCAKLVNHKADPDVKDKHGQTPLNDAVTFHKDTVADLLRGKHKQAIQHPTQEASTILCRAAYEGDEEHMKRLIRNGADVNCANSDGRAAVHIAACEGYATIVSTLLESKADGRMKDNNGITPLADSIEQQKTEVQAVLRAEGISLGESGEMELSVKMCDLASKNDLDGLRLMVLNGCDVGNGDYDMRTPLHLAASNEQLACLEYMLKIEPKINVNPIDRFGGTPLEDAYRHNNRTAIHLLEQWGGLRKDDPSQGNALEEQKTNVKALAKKAREPLVESASKTCKEQMAFEYLSGFFYDDVHSKLNELQSCFENVYQRMCELIDHSMAGHFSVSVADLPDTIAHRFGKQELALERIESVEDSQDLTPVTSPLQPGAKMELPQTISPGTAKAVLDSGWTTTQASGRSPHLNTGRGAINRMPSNLIPGRTESIASSDEPVITVPTVKEHEENGESETSKTTPDTVEQQGSDVDRILSIPRLQSYKGEEIEESGNGAGPEPEAEPKPTESDDSYYKPVEIEDAGRPAATAFEHLGKAAPVSNVLEQLGRAGLAEKAVLKAKQQFKNSHQTLQASQIILEQAEKIRSDLTDLKHKIQAARKAIEPDCSWTPKFSESGVEDDKESWECKTWRMATIQYREHSQVLKKRLLLQMDLYKLLRRLMRELIRVTQRKIRAFESQSNFYQK